MFSLSSISKKYNSGSEEKWALKDINLFLPSVGLVAIIGRSGSGKSTLLNILSMLEEPSKGRILYKNKDLAKYTRKKKEDFRAYECAFVYQHFNLYESLSAVSNVALPLQIKGDSSKKAHDKALRLLKEYGLDHLAEKKVTLLSGGEKQRIAILRSIISEPSFLLCDEPTGALDSANEKLVMEELKRISKDRLVILVSHNRRIVDEYADKIVELDEGKIIRNDVRESPEEWEKPKRKKRRRSVYTDDIFEQNYKKDRWKNIFSIISGTLGYAALLLSFGFFAGSQKTLDEEATKTLLYNQASISETVHYEIEGSPLSLSQSSRPKLNIAKDVLEGVDCRIANDYSYFFPAYQKFTLGAKEESCYFTPLDDYSGKAMKSSFAYEGEWPEDESLSTCIVNKEFASMFNESPLGKQISVSHEIEVELDDEIETVLIDNTFLVKAIVEEFSFLNSARVYYSHYALEQYLKTIYFPILSDKTATDLTAYGIVNEASGNSPYSAYSYLIFIEKEGMSKFKEVYSSLSSATGFTLFSEALTIGDSFSSLTSAFSLSLIPFLALSLAAFCFILGSLTLSSFIEKKKEAAILEALGSRKEDRGWLYKQGALINSLLSAILALLISYPLSLLFNIYLESMTGLKNVIVIPYASYMGVRYFPILAIVALALILGYLCSSFPLWAYGRMPLSEELRDE